MFIKYMKILLYGLISFIISNVPSYSAMFAGYVPYSTGHAGYTKIPRSFLEAGYWRDSRHALSYYRKSGGSTSYYVRRMRNNLPGILSAFESFTILSNPRLRTFASIPYVFFADTGNTIPTGARQGYRFKPNTRYYGFIAYDDEHGASDADDYVVTARVYSGYSESLSPPPPTSIKGNLTIPDYLTSGKVNTSKLLLKANFNIEGSENTINYK